MVLRKTVEDREWDKFTECDGGLTHVRTKLCSDSTIRPSGLTVEGKITIVTINDTSWTVLPASVLTDRNAISIQNQSDIQIKINFDNTVGYVGIIIAGGGERFYDITDDILIYARSSSGNVDVAIEEVA